MGGDRVIGWGGSLKVRVEDLGVWNGRWGLGEWLNKGWRVKWLVWGGKVRVKEMGWVGWGRR